MTDVQLLTQVIFFGFAVTLVFSALMVIISRNPVRSALFLILAFFASAGLWLMLQAEFLGLVLILVYVGAVMTLFLFVVMTLNVDVEVERKGFIRYLPYGIAILCLLVALVVYVVVPQHFSSETLVNASLPVDYSNTKALGDVLYTDFAFPFEIAGSILLLAIIAAISLTHRKRRYKNLTADQQVNIQLKDRIKMVNLPPEKKNDSVD